MVETILRQPVAVCAMIAVLCTAMGAPGKATAASAAEGGTLPAIQSRTALINSVHRMMEDLQKNKPKRRDVQSVGDFDWFITRHRGVDGLQMTVVTTGATSHWEDYICLTRNQTVVYFCRRQRYFFMEKRKGEFYPNVNKVDHTITHEYFFSDGKTLLFYCSDDSDGPGDEYPVEKVRRIAKYISGIQMTGKAPNLDRFFESIEALFPEPDVSDARERRSKEKR